MILLLLLLLMLTSVVVVVVVVVLWVILLIRQVVVVLVPTLPLSSHDVHLISARDKQQCVSLGRGDEESTH